MTAEILGVERFDATVLLTINRPRAGNAISAEVTAALEDAVASLAGDATLRAVVITGAGDKFFSSGGDIKRYRALTTRAALEDAFSRARQLLDHIEALPVPVVAAVNGYALGGGAELMLACDIRIAAAHASIGFPYVRLGLMPGWHGTERLARDIGYAPAMQLLATGEPVDAHEAYRLGLVNAVVENAPVVTAALDLARRWHDAAPLALAACKRALGGAFHLPRAEARNLATDLFAELWLTEDHREAEAAFAEKRKPRFKGR